MFGKEAKPKHKKSNSESSTAVGSGPDISRREFIRNGGLAAGAALFLAADTQPSISRNSERVVAVRPEGGMSYEYSENFKNQLIGYKKFYSELKTDEILFLDEQGLPIGEPVKILPLGDVAPGELDEHGIVKDLDQEWLDAQRAALKKKYPDVLVDVKRDIPRQTNLIFLARDLATVFTDESITDNPSYIDVVTYFANKISTKVLLKQE
jgi:hypothetical protein